MAVLAVPSLLGYVVFELTLDTPSFVDLWVYRAEGLAVRDGLDLYGPLPGVHGVNTYPPFAALLFVPATFISITGLKVLSVVANLALLFVVSWQSVRRVRGAGPRTAVAGCALAAVALWTEPVITTISYGQINLLLLALVLWDFNLPPDSRLRGVGVGLAARDQGDSGDPDRLPRAHWAIPRCSDRCRDCPGDDRRDRARECGRHVELLDQASFRPWSGRQARELDQPIRPWLAGCEQITVETPGRRSSR